MPILKVEIVGSRADFPENLAQRIADAAGAALDSRPQGTWVTTRFVDLTDYAENGGRDGSLRPVTVSLLLSQHPPNKELPDMMVALTDAISSATGVPPENVHIILEPNAKGRVSFGGNLVV